MKKILNNTLIEINSSSETIKLPNSSHKLFAAGPLSKQPGTMSGRLVLIERIDSNDPYVVYWQTFNNHDENTVDLSESSYHAGSYFKADRIGDAIKCFAERLAREADSYQSLYVEQDDEMIAANFADEPFPRLAFV